MTHNEFDHLLHRIKALTPEQMQRLRQELDSEQQAAESRHGRSVPTPLTEAQFKRELLDSGLMTTLPTPAEPATRRAFQPVKIEGEPISETILRERR